MTHPIDPYASPETLTPEQLITLLASLQEERRALEELVADMHDKDLLHAFRNVLNELHLLRELVGGDEE